MSRKTDNCESPYCQNNAKVISGSLATILTAHSAEALAPSQYTTEQWTADKGMQIDLTTSGQYEKFVEVFREDAVPTVEQIAIVLLEADCLPRPLKGPGHCRVCRDFYACQAPPRSMPTNQSFESRHDQR